MENKILRKHQSLKSVNNDVLFINNSKKKKLQSNNYINNYGSELFESNTYLPLLSKKKNITTSNSNIKDSKIKEKLNKNQEKNEKHEKSDTVKSIELQLKPKHVFSNDSIEISRDTSGIKRRYLKNENHIDLISSLNNINKENNKENINIYIKGNSREKKVIPQWQNLINDYTNDIKVDDKYRITTKIRSKIDQTSSKEYLSPDSSSVLSPSSSILSPTNTIQTSLNSEQQSYERIVQSPINDSLHSSNSTIIQSPISIKKNGTSKNKVSKIYSEIKKNKNSSLGKSKNKSKSSSLYKLNKSGSIGIEKNKRIPSKKLSNSSEILNKKKDVKEQLIRKKSNNNNINKTNSYLKNNNDKNKNSSESLNKSNPSIKSINKENIYHSKTKNSNTSNNNNNNSNNNNNNNIIIKNSNFHNDNKLPNEELQKQKNNSDLNEVNNNLNILSSNGSLANSFITILSDSNNKSENFNKIIKYPITSYQLGLFNRIDSVDTTKCKRNSYYYTVKCYQINKSLNPNIMKKVINKICDKYSVLKTRFYRNNKIIDANIEAIIDEETFYNKIIGNYDNINDYNTDFSYFEEVRLQNYPELRILSENSIQQFIENWINNIPIFENQFKTFMFNCGLDKDWTSFRRNSFGMTDSNTESLNSIEDITLSDDTFYIDPEDKISKTFIAIVGSIMIADEVSLNAIFNEIMSLYSHEEIKYDNNSSIKDRKVKDSFDEFKSKENSFSFINYAQEQKINIDKATVSIEKIKSFWKKQCTEVNNDILLPKEREDMIEQLKRSKEDLIENKERYNKLEKKKAEYELTIEKLTNDRIQLEISNGSVATVIDPVNGERLEITNEAKQVILKMITGSETTLTIEPFLIKHEVSEHVRKCIRSSILKIEDFASLSDKDLEIFQLEPSEKRKIAALIEFVRNRIRECIQSQSKVKISIERQLSKVQREYDRCVRDFKKYEKIIEKETNNIIKINSILHPPLKISHIPVMKLQGVRQKSVNKNDWGEYSLYYSFMPLHLESEQNQYFQQFFDDWKNKYYKEYRVQRCLKKKMEREKNELVNIEDVPLVEPDYDYLSEDDIYSNSENVSNSFYNNMPSTEAICLAIFGVLLRHISGIEKFIIGIHQSQRRIYQTGDCIIGPLSNIIPIKIDLSQKGITFYNLFSDLIFSIKKLRKINAEHSYAELIDCPDLPEELPIQFEFISKEECELWRKMGLKIEDLFSGINRNEGWTRNDVSLSTSSSRSSSFYSNKENPENIDSETLKYYPKIKQLWSSNASNTFIFKLIMVEWDDDTIEGGILYSRNHFDEDQISKWVGKLETLIENIELGKPKVTVANLISRLYQNLRWKGSQMLLSSSIQLYDKRKTLTTSLIHLGGAKKE